MKTDPPFDFFHLDQHRLDEEWLEQPRLFYKHAAKLAEARFAHEQAKAVRDVVAAELDLEVRAEPEKYGLTKATESSIQSAVQVQRRYRQSNRRVLQAQHEVHILQAVVDALDHRKKSLENLVHLFSMNYFSQPKAPKEAEERMNHVERKHAFTPKHKRRPKLE